MVQSVIDRVEQAQLAELFIALESAVPADTRFAESVTFWRYQLLIGMEPSQVAELLVVLDEAASCRHSATNCGATFGTGDRSWNLARGPRSRGGCRPIVTRACLARGHPSSQTGSKTILIADCCGSHHAPVGC
jgi:hypothetical protein